MWSKVYELLDKLNDMCSDMEMTIVENTIDDMTEDPCSTLTYLLNYY